MPDATRSDLAAQLVRGFREFDRVQSDDASNALHALLTAFLASPPMEAPPAPAPASNPTFAALGLPAA